MLENESKFVFYILIILYHKRLFFLMTKEAVMLPHSSFHVIFSPCTSGYISSVGIYSSQVKMWMSPLSSSGWVILETHGKLRILSSYMNFSFCSLAKEYKDD